MIEITALASGSAGNCYHITDGESPLLIECGLPWREIRKCLDFATSSLAGVLVSHEHQDHAKSVEDAMKAGLDVYASQGTFDVLGLCGHRARFVASRKQFALGTWTVLPFETEHDAAEPLGFLLASSNGGKLLYATDTYYVRYRFTGLTHAMLECNYASDILAANVANGSVPTALKNRLLRSHFSLANVKGFLRANDLSQVREIWLLHLSDGNSDAERFRNEVMALTGKPVYVA
ncbi:MAG: MBL fold metallo-hydrolase [Bacillota bacterium]|jgi:phosphoribosyl 1,2-cyclic phosphodiesterase